MANIASTDVSAGVQPKSLRVGQVAVAHVHSVAASMSTGDVIQLIHVPKGATVTYLMANCRLAGVGSVRVGDGVSTNRYVTDTAASISAGVMVINNPSFVPYTYSTDDTIDVVCSASTNYSAGSFVIVAHLSMDV